MLNGTLMERVKSHEGMLDSLLQGDCVALTGRVAVLLPDEPGVYRISEVGSASEDSVYVGESRSIRKRVCRNHLMGYPDRSGLRRRMLSEGAFEDEAEIDRYLRSQCHVQFVVLPDVGKRLLFEHFAVSVLSPLWNS